MCQYTYHHYHSCGHMAKWTIESCSEFTNKLRQDSNEKSSCININHQHDVLPENHPRYCLQCELDWQEQFNLRFPKSRQNGAEPDRVEGLGTANPFLDLQVSMNFSSTPGASSSGQVDFLDTTDTRHEICHVGMALVSKDATTNLDHSSSDCLNLYKRKHYDWKPQLSQFDSPWDPADIAPIWGATATTTENDKNKTKIASNNNSTDGSAVASHQGTFYDSSSSPDLSSRASPNSIASYYGSTTTPVTSTTGDYDADSEADFDSEIKPFFIFSLFDVACDSPLSRDSVSVQLDCHDHDSGLDLEEPEGYGELVEVIPDPEPEPEPSTLINPVGNDTTSGTSSNSSTSNISRPDIAFLEPENENESIIKAISEPGSVYGTPPSSPIEYNNIDINTNININNTTANTRIRPRLTIHIPDPPFLGGTAYNMRETCYLLSPAESEDGFDTINWGLGILIPGAHSDILKPHAYRYY